VSRKHTFQYVVDKLADEISIKVICDTNNNFYGETEKEALNKARNWISSEYDINEGNIELIQR